MRQFSDCPQIKNQKFFRKNTLSDSKEVTIVSRLRSASIPMKIFQATFERMPDQEERCRGMLSVFGPERRGLVKVSCSQISTCFYQGNIESSTVRRMQDIHNGQYLFSMDREKMLQFEHDWNDNREVLLAELEKTGNFEFKGKLCRWLLDVQALDEPMIILRYADIIAESGINIASVFSDVSPLKRLPGAKMIRSHFALEADQQHSLESIAKLESQLKPLKENHGWVCKLQRLQESDISFTSTI